MAGRKTGENGALGALLRRPVVIVTGHYGSGKTEFSLNLALGAARGGRRTALADLDIVNPYFRSREYAPMLEAHGVRVLAGGVPGTGADVPSLSPDIQAAFDEEGLQTIFDVGGDPVGAKVLGRYHDSIVRVPHDMFFVVNANRPETRDARGADRYLRSVEAASRLSVTGIVNNTHLCGETTAGDIRRGADVAAELSERTGVPVVTHLAAADLAGEAAGFVDPVFPIEIFLKNPWEI